MYTHTLGMMYLICILHYGITHHHHQPFYNKKNSIWIVINRHTYTLHLSLYEQRNEMALLHLLPLTWKQFRWKLVSSRILGTAYVYRWFSDDNIIKNNFLNRTGKDAKILIKLERIHQHPQSSSSSFCICWEAKKVAYSYQYGNEPWILPRTNIAEYHEWRNSG